MADSPENSQTVTDAEELFKKLKEITSKYEKSKALVKDIGLEYAKLVEAAKELNDAEQKTQQLNAIKETQQQRLNKLKELQSTIEQLAAVSTVNLSGEAAKFADHQKATLAINKSLLMSQLGITDAIIGETDFLKNLQNEYKAILKSLEEKNKKEEKSKKSFADIKEGAKLFFGELTGINASLFTMSGFLIDIAKKFNEFEDSAFDVRKTMGLIKGEEGAKGFDTLLTNVTTKMARIGVTAKDVGDGIANISKTFGSSAFATEDILENFTALSTSFGIATDTSAKSLKNLMGISQSSSASNKSMIGFAKSLSAAAQVPLVEIMQDLSTISEAVRSTFRGSSEQLVKSTVQARRLGITLEATGQIAEKLLNFQESINAEIEASVLLGKNISFNDARVLAYRGDILGASKSVLETVKKTADLNKLDYFTLKAIAEASGLTVGQLQESIQIEKDLKILRSSGSEEAKKLTAEYQRLNGLSGEGVKTEAELAMERIKSTNNLAQQKQILAEIQSMFYDIAALLMPVFQVLGKIAKALGELPKPVKYIFLSVGLLTAAFIKLSTIGVPAVQGLGASISASITAISASISAAITTISASFTAALATLATAGTAVTSLSAILGPAAGILLAFGAAAILSGVGVYYLGKGVMILVESFGKFVEILSNLSGDQFANLTKNIFALSAAMTASAMSLFGFSVFIFKLGTFAAIIIPLAISMGYFADSFAKFVNLFAENNFDNIKTGIGNIKSSIKELREEINKFSNKDINILEKLSTLNKTATITPSEKEKKDEMELLKESIKSAVIDGMRQVKIIINLDSRAVGTGVATAMAVSQPTSAYSILARQSTSV